MRPVHRAAGAIAGVGVDAVDVERFRRVLDRRPRFAARCFTESERSDAGGSADGAQSLAARFAAKEAVMKALGTGIGGFALHRRGGVPDDGEGRHPERPLPRAARRRRRAGGRAGRRHASTCRSPTPTAWRSPSSSRSRLPAPACAPS